MDIIKHDLYFVFNNSHTYFGTFLFFVKPSHFNVKKSYSSVELSNNSSVTCDKTGNKNSWSSPVPNYKIKIKLR